MSVCNLFLKQWWNLLSVDSEWRLLYHVRSSRISLSLVIDRSCAFFPLACSTIDCCDSLDFIASLFVWRIRLWNLNPSLLDRWFYLNGWKVLHVYAWLTACLRNLYRSKKLSGHVVFLLLRISHLAKDSFLLPHRSIKTRIWSLCLFLGWLSILSQWVKSACIVCILF